MKITLSGTPASGKSTVAKLLAEKLGYKHFSMGDVQREIAKDKGVTIKELADLEAKDKSLDLMVDQKQEDIGKNNDDFVMDSWLAGKFVSDSIKIFIDADPFIRAERRSRHKRDEEDLGDVNEALKNMTEREKINRERWKRYYDFDFMDLSNYDLIIDSTHLTIEQVVQEIYDFVNSFDNN